MTDKSPGRPTKLTPEVQEKLLQALSVGSPRAHAAAYAGVDDSTLRRWLVRGRKEDEGPYAEFRQVVLEAESRAQMAAMACVTKAVREGDWKAAAWMLERRRPEQFAPRSRLFDPHRVLEILDDQGLVVDRDQALQALASADQNLPLQTEDQDDLEGIEVSEEDRKLLFKILRAADQVRAGGARAVNADVQSEAEAA